MGTKDRITAIRVGRALEAQRFFHDVNYENRLVDDIIELYQFNELLFRGFLADNSSHSSFNNFSVTSTVISDYYERDEEEDDDNESTTTSPQQQIQGKEDEIVLPNGIYIDLTHCYTPTCNSNLYPCYSYTCPKKERLVKNKEKKL